MAHEASESVGDSLSPTALRVDRADFDPVGLSFTFARLARRRSRGGFDSFSLVVHSGTSTK